MSEPNLIPSRVPGYSVDPAAGVVYGRRGKPLRCAPNGCGYRQVGNGGRNVGAVHRIVYEAVHGPIPPGLQINHRNGVKTDNRIENLEAVTCAENIRHAHHAGLCFWKGERNGFSRLTEADVRAIRASGGRPCVLARRYGVSRSTVGDVLRRRTWGHVE